MRVRAGDFGVGTHPVMGIGHTLLGGQQRQKRSEGIQREPLPGREMQHLAAHLEPVARLCVAQDPGAGRCKDLDAQVKQFEMVIRHTSQSINNPHAFARQAIHGQSPAAMPEIPSTHRPEKHKTLLRVERLSKHFDGHRAVHAVSFELPAGAIGGLIGPNGAGKTTLFNCLAGFLQPTSGQVWLDDVAIGGLAASAVFAHGVARTFQIPRPFPEMTVLENVMLAPAAQLGERFWANWLRPAAVTAQERQTREAARHWLAFVGLDALEQQPARVLSGGQRKLLELARVMVAKPRLVLLDEPGAGVNPALLDQIVDKVAALNASGTTFLIIEHNMDLVATLCRPVMVMAAGELLTTGDADAVLTDPRVVEAYLGDAA